MNCSDPYSLDYGADENGKLKLHGPEGPVPLPETPRGLTPADKFLWILSNLLESHCIVCESPTIGSSGAEPGMIAEIVADSPHKIYLISARRVKNYLKDHPDEEKTDAGCARIIYDIATSPNAELKEWRYVLPEDKFHRMHTSVRPHDKRLYRGDQPDLWMSNLVPFDQIPGHIQELLNNGRKRNPDYRRPAVLPFAMAFDEEGADTRDGYEKVIGLYEHGYPSFYRRCTVTLMQAIAKKNAGVSRFAEVTPGQRKQAWKEARRVIRCIYYLSRQHQEYMQISGILNPLTGHGVSRESA